MNYLILRRSAFSRIASSTSFVCVVGDCFSVMAANKRHTSGWSRKSFTIFFTFILDKFTEMYIQLQHATQADHAGRVSSSWNNNRNLVISGAASYHAGFQNENTNQNANAISAIGDGRNRQTGCHQFTQADAKGTRRQNCQTIKIAKGGEWNGIN